MNGFGPHVRQLRLAAGMSQAELAEAAGISERTVSDLERGLRSSVYPATARSLATALHVGQAELPGFLLLGQGQEPAPTGIDTSRLPAAFRSRIPPRPYRLIGRESELAHVLQLVRDPEVSIVTLVGPGGVGKTRLATEVAAITEDEFSAGVFFINLSAVDDPALVGPAIATNVGVQPGTSAWIELLSQRLAHGRSMIVLDTFEHLLPAASAIAELADVSPGLTILSTTRSALHLRAEVEVAVRPLPVGPRGDMTAPSPAALLFWERARALAPDLSAEMATSEVVHDICARLDGLPLALELACARVRHMSLSDLRRNLDHRLDTLGEGSRDMPPRHRTMRAALDWSYSQLGGAELRLFRDLGVFRGGFSLEALHAVVAAPSTAATAAATLSSLSLLVDASLVVFEATPAGHSRYRLLDLVREYAVERSVAAGEYQRLRERHARHFLSLAEQAEPELRGRQQSDWYERLLAEEGNFRAAVTWALESDEADIALRLTGSLWMFWRWAGLFTEARGWLEAALEAGHSGPSHVRLPALWAAGWLAFHQGDYARTGDIGREMLGLLPTGDEGPFRRHALTLVGNAAIAEERTADGIVALGQAVTISERLDDRWILATSLLNLGAANLRDDRVNDARRHFERALSIYEEIGDLHFTARVLAQLSNTALVEGRLEEANDSVRRAAEISAGLGDAWGVAETLEAAANVTTKADPDSAAVLAGAAQRLRGQIAMRQHPVDAYINSRHLDEARSSLGDDAFQAALWTGQAMRLEQAVAFLFSTLE